jgi:hypothetical protein
MTLVGSRTTTRLRTLTNVRIGVLHVRKLFLSLFQDDRKCAWIVNIADQVTSLVTIARILRRSLKTHRFRSNSARIWIALDLH